MRPVIDGKGAMLVDDDGNVIPGIKKFTVVCEHDNVMIVRDVEFIATHKGKSLSCRYGAEGEK